VLVVIEIEFCLLGPLIVRRGPVTVTVPRGKQRVILAMLLLNAGRVVRLDELVETLWVSGPPPSGPVAVQNYVMRLRNTLGDAGRARITTQPPGYLIRVQPDELDLYRFEALLGAARTAAGDGSWDQAATRAREALQLWRGEPLTGVDSEALAAREASRLAELRLQALELRIDADLHLARHPQVIAELRQLADAHPLRERVHGQLMLALYRDGRQAEALAAYRHARDVLIAELGVEPGLGLRDLHQQILSADPVLTTTEPAPAARAERERVARREPASSVPRELPPSVPDFTGRSAELAALTKLLDRPGQQVPGAVVISAIGGTAGVGKTALAVHWAHKVAGRFPDGQLYVNLHGYDPGQPKPTVHALAGFLRSLGVPGQDIPPEEDERAARYRSLLAGKRMLVVLDNARSAEQVRPLLPGTPSCTVLVTSRDALAGLTARDGATRLDLDVLPLQDAVALLRALTGTRAAAEPAAAAELADLCCRLPLALRVAAELAAARPAMPLAELTGELADLRTRLDLLEAGGDPPTEVRTVFSWSYRHLDAAAARTFRLLGLHPGPDLEPHAAAALTRATVPQARRTLDALARAHLIQPAAPNRYGMHDLLRGYARELSTSLDGAQEQHAALTQLFDHYLHAAATAMDTLSPAGRYSQPPIPQPPTPVPPLADLAAARQWLDAERAVLVAVAGHSAARGWPGHATRLAATLATYLFNGGHLPEALILFSHALGAARHAGDRAAEAMALKQIGDVDFLQSRFQQAADHYQQALALFRSAGDKAGVARTLSGMGVAETELGRYEEAARHQREAIAICHDIGNRFGEARSLGNLGWVRQRQGRYQEAAGYHQQALALSHELGDREGEALTLTRLGGINLRLGRYQHATGPLQQALTMFRDMGNRAEEAEALAMLGHVYAGLGRYQQAAGNFEQALAVYREIGDPGMEAYALNGLGGVLCQTGETGKARTHHATALQLASQAGTPLEQARAHSGLARACDADGDSVQARHHWQEALSRYTAIGAPEADEIRARLP
jgi:DNA-binding SARP family transcriptional activator/Tfp pilus assembly protein PilF